MNMNTEERVAVNMLSKYSAQIISMGVSFFLTPFLIVHLGRIMLGLQVLADQTLRYCLLLNSSISQGYSRFATVHYARSEYEQMNRILGKGLSIVMLLTVPSVLVVIAAAVFPDVLFGLSTEVLTYARVIILITGVGAVIGMFLGLWSSALFIMQRFYVADVGASAAKLLSAVSVVVIFYFVRPSIIIWVGLVVGIGLMINLFYVIPSAKRALPQMRIRPVFASLKESKDLLTFSGMSFLGSLGYLLYYSTDSIMISNLNELGSEKIIVYNLAQRWDPFVRQIVLALAFSLTPVLTRLVATNDFDALRRALCKGTRYCLLLGLLPCILLASYSKPFILLWVGPSFVPETSRVLLWLMVSLIASIPAIMGYQVLFALGKLKEATITTFCGGILNIFLSIFFVKYVHLGLMGIALGTIITLSLKNSFYMPYLVSKKVSIKLTDYIRSSFIKPLLCALPMIAVSLSLQAAWSANSWVTLCAQLGICGFVYAVSVYCIGLFRQEKEKIRQGTARVYRVIRPSRKDAR